MKAKVTEAIRGSIILPAIGGKPFGTGSEFELNDEQYRSVDIQKALELQQIKIISGKVPKVMDTVELCNITNNSVNIPDVQIVRPGKRVAVPVNKLKDPVIKYLIDEHYLSISGAKPVEIQVEGKKVKKVTISRPPVKPTKVKKGKKDHSIKKKHVAGEEESMIIDTDTVENGIEPGEKGGIKFVDIEETERRIASHPTLSKLGKKK